MINVMKTMDVTLKLFVPVSPQKKKKKKIVRTWYCYLLLSFGQSFVTNLVVVISYNSN